MPRIYRVAIIALTIFFFVGMHTQRCMAVLIDFEDGVGQDVVIPSDHYAGLTFSNAVWISTGFHDGFFGLGVDAGIVAGNNWAFPGTSSPIVVEFAVPLSEVSIDAFDVQDRGAQLEAFDAGGSSLGIDSFSTTSSAQDVTLSVSSFGIVKIELTQLVNATTNGDGLGWDNLSYSPVPEPSTISLAIASLLCLVGVRRRLL